MKKKTTNLNKLTIKEYVDKIASTQYIPDNLTFDSPSQIELERTRNIINKEPKGNIRLFANNVTKNWQYPKAPQRLRILDFVDERFFSRVILYFMFFFVVESLVTDRHRHSVEYELRDFLSDIIEEYLSTKKIKKKAYSNLSPEDKSLMFDEFLANFWANLFELNLINRTSSGIISLNKDVNFALFDNLLTVKFKEYPCVYTPKPWSIEGKDGGYYTIQRPFITKRPNFVGKTEWSAKLIKLINNLQETAWSIDFPIKYIDDEFYYDENKLLHSTNIEDKEDIIQYLHTRFFIQNFCTKADQFFYPYQLDFRGRIYPLCSWGYTPTSSKKIRHYLRTNDYYTLTPEAINWLKVKIGYMLNLKSKTYNDMLSQVSLLNLEEVINNMPDSYLHYNIQSILSDIEKKETNQLVQFDATSSVYQIIAILINDKKLMEHTNLIDPEETPITAESTFEYKDIYTYIQKECVKYLPHPTAFNIFLERDIIKGLLMPLLYGKTEHESVNNLMDHIDIIEDTYLSFESGDTRTEKDRYNLDELRKYPKEDLLAALPDELKTKFSEVISTNKASTIYNKKKDYMCRLFIRCLKHTLFIEFPRLKIFYNMFKGKEAIFKNEMYSTPYFSFQSLYKKTKTYIRSAYVNNKRTRFSYKLILNELEKKTNGEAANFIHSKDSFLIHYILDKKRVDVPVMPIHDCLMMHPSDATYVLGIARDAYISLQKQTAEHPVFSKFHEEGSHEITSRHMFKFEYKEVKSYKDNTTKGNLI